MMHGFHPWTGNKEGYSQKCPSAEEWKKGLEQAWGQVKEALEKVL